MRRSIVVRTRFRALHHWPDAPDAVAFLRNTHRHDFHVRAAIQVFHDDRELEFLLVKESIDSFTSAMPVDVGAMSCEMMAASIIGWLQKQYGVDRYYHVEVSEDGENSALVAVEAGETL